MAAVLESRAFHATGAAKTLLSCGFARWPITRKSKSRVE
jgi:hypothetical protein